jgi:hypothetical protein
MLDVERVRQQLKPVFLEARLRLLVDCLFLSAISVVPAFRHGKGSKVEKALAQLFGWDR